MNRSRKLLALLAALTLLVPAAALAARNGTYVAGKGKIQRGYNLKFTVKGNRIVKLSGKVLESCDGSAYSDITTIHHPGPWKIGAGGRFKGRKKEKAHGVTVYTTLEGRISGSTATGTVKQESLVAGSYCTTYKLKFTAKRR